ncbi:hypothetical protein [uncultured Psychrosphaera sp.]|jgi:hypothetical protein|uniref:hypothetical protein n=1 Tax=uncultured Psychrosphaera sp. TaxID=1403522 RepID=UPI0030FC9A6D
MKYQITVKGYVISISVLTIFNHYDTNSMVKNLTEIIEGFDGQPFYMLIDLSMSDGGTPEAFEQTRKFNLWLDEQNLKAKAIVCPSPLLKNINESRVRTSDKQRIEYFQDIKSALNWFDELSLQYVI